MRFRAMRRARDISYLRVADSQPDPADTSQMLEPRRKNGSAITPEAKGQKGPVRFLSLMQTVALCRSQGDGGRMRLKRTCIAASLMTAAVLMSAQVAVAARIYNYLPVPVHVISSLNGRTTVAAGARSESISWGQSNMVTVHVTPRYLDGCLLSFGPHAEMTGGHYLVIGHQGRTISCELCDSDHRLMHSSRGTAPKEIWKELDAQRSSRTGC